MTAGGISELRRDRAAVRPPVSTICTPNSSINPHLKKGLTILSAFFAENGQPKNSVEDLFSLPICDIMGIRKKAPFEKDGDSKAWNQLSMHTALWEVWALPSALSYRGKTGDKSQNIVGGIYGIQT